MSARVSAPAAAVKLPWRWRQWKELLASYLRRMALLSHLYSLTSTLSYLLSRLYLVSVLFVSVSSLVYHGHRQLLRVRKRAQERKCERAQIPGVKQWDQQQRRDHRILPAVQEKARQWRRWYENLPEVRIKRQEL